MKGCKQSGQSLSYSQWTMGSDNSDWLYILLVQPENGHLVKATYFYKCCANKEHNCCILLTIQALQALYIVNPTRNWTSGLSFIFLQLLSENRWLKHQRHLAKPQISANTMLSENILVTVYLQFSLCSVIV